MHCSRQFVCALFSPQKNTRQILISYLRTCSWWFQSIWKTLVKMDHFPKWGWKTVNIKNLWNHDPANVEILLVQMQAPLRCHWRRVAQPPPESKFPELASDAKAEIAADWSKVCLCCNSLGVVVGWVDGSKKWCLYINGNRFFWYIYIYTN